MVYLKFYLITFIFYEKYVLYNKNKSILFKIFIIRVFVIFQENRMKFMGIRFKIYLLKKKTICIKVVCLKKENNYCKIFML